MSGAAEIVYVLEERLPGDVWRVSFSCSASVKRWVIENDVEYMKQFEEEKKRSERTFYRVARFVRAS